MKVDGENVAAFKDEGGCVHAVSAVCTHMGCLVGWNATDRTWDCPCHGSRFELSGEVIHGPATQPLGAQDHRHQADFVDDRIEQQAAGRGEHGDEDRARQAVDDAKAGDGNADPVHRSIPRRIGEHQLFNPPFVPLYIVGYGEDTTLHLEKSCTEMRIAICAPWPPFAAAPLPRPRPKSLSNWLLAVAALVLLMIVVGGITRLTESGLSITRWEPVSGRCRR
jgi:nitrite reductase/ring-hydroxylating ferredoxin subunit